MIEPKDLTIAKKLKDVRLERKIKQSVMAEMLGFKDQQECSDYETGKKHFTEEVVRKMCKVLNVSFKEISLKNYDKNKNKDKNKDKNSQDEDGIMLLNFKKLLIEKEIRIVQLELELKQLKRIGHVDSGKDSKVYVII